MKKLLLPLLIATSMSMTACCDCKPTRGKLSEASTSSSDSNKPTEHDDHQHGSDSHSSDSNSHDQDANHHHDEHEHGDGHSEDKHQHDDNQNNEASQADKSSESIVSTVDLNKIEVGDFDWSTIKNSKANIGSFPYFSTPEGMKLVVADGTAPEGQAVSKTLDDGRLNLFDTKKIVSEEGKLSYLNIIMAEDGQEFDKQAFDGSVSDYMTQIGAVEFFNDTLPTDVSQQLSDMDGLNHEKYMTGKFSNRKLRQFAVNHDNGKLFYQVMSDDKHGEIGVLEVLGFNAPLNTQPATDSNSDMESETEKQAANTEKPPQQPTANSINKQISNSGRAILNINFDIAKSTVSENDKKIVDEIYTLLKENPDLKLSIEGHTDSSGDAEMNGFLSQARAEEVEKMLIKKGIDKSRLKSKGFGEAKPLVDNDTKENRAKNRRVELVKFN